MSGDITTILPKNVLLQNHQKHYKQQSTENFNFKNFVLKACIFFVLEGPGWLNELGSWIYLTTHTSLSPIRHGFTHGFVNYKKGALDSQTQMIKFTSYLPMVGGSLRILRLLPPLKLVVMIMMI